VQAQVNPSCKRPPATRYGNATASPVAARCSWPVQLRESPAGLYGGMHTLMLSKTDSRFVRHRSRVLPAGQVMTRWLVPARCRLALASASALQLFKLIPGAGAPHSVYSIAHGRCDPRCAAQRSAAQHSAAATAPLVDAA
jgi:hypothetical protein